MDERILVVDEDTLIVLRAQTGRLRRLAEDICAVCRAEEGHLALGPEPVIATAHHGTITADSPGPGLGATFTLTLPEPG